MPSSNHTVYSKVPFYKKYSLIINEVTKNFVDLLLRTQKQYCGQKDNKNDDNKMWDKYNPRTDNINWQTFPSAFHFSKTLF